MNLLKLSPTEAPIRWENSKVYLLFVSILFTLCLSFTINSPSLLGSCRCLSSGALAGSPCKWNANIASPSRCGIKREWNVPVTFASELTSFIDPFRSKCKNVHGELNKMPNGITIWNVTTTHTNTQSKYSENYGIILEILFVTRKYCIRVAAIILHAVNVIFQAFHWMTIWFTSTMCTKNIGFVVCCSSSMALLGQP